MNIGENRIEATFPRGDSFFARFWNVVKKIWERYKKWKRTKDHCRLLLEMSDYYLQDMGLSRADAVRFSRQRESLWKVLFNGAKDETCHR